MRTDTAIRKRAAVTDGETAGAVADSMDVRRGIMERIHSGAITLAQGQAELAAIKRGAKRNGQITRAQAFARG